MGVNTMKQPKLKKWDKLEIVWNDASVDNTATDTDKFFKEFKPCVRRTLGYYVGTRENYICICETDDREADVWDVTPQDCERINAIPFGMITELNILQ